MMQSMVLQRVRAACATEQQQLFTKIVAYYFRKLQAENTAMNKIKCVAISEEDYSKYFYHIRIDSSSFSCTLLQSLVNVWMLKTGIDNFLHKRWNLSLCSSASLTCMLLYFSVPYWEILHSHFPVARSPMSSENKTILMNTLHMYFTGYLICCDIYLPFVDRKDNSLMAAQFGSYTSFAWSQRETL